MKLKRSAGNPAAECGERHLKEKAHAAEVGIYILGGTLLLAGFLGSWIKAWDEGGLWWLVAGVAFVLGLVVGERLKKRMEFLVRRSREERGKSKS